MQEAERRIPIQYSNRSSSSYGGQQTFLPFRLNSAGVMPVIIASVLMGLPSMIGLYNEKFKLFIDKYLSTDKPVGFTIYILIVFIFTYIYTYMMINPNELSKNLNQNGGYIPGIRPGKETKEYISKVLSRITFLGAIFICVIAALPILFATFSKFSSSVSIGGTSILIVVGVMIETYKQVESAVASRGYNRRIK